MTKATVYFIYDKEPARSFDCEFTDKSIEDTIRYWMGKSPGMYEVSQILVIQDGTQKDWMWVLAKICDEEMDFQEKQRAMQERETYERLKSKFEGTK